MKFSRVLVFLIMSLFIIGCVIYMKGIRYNFTPSFAHGFYIIEDTTPPYPQGSLVIFCPPDNEAFRLASKRKYLPLGVCGAGDYRPLIKRVIGLEGDNILIKEKVHVNGTLVPNSTVKTHDSKGRLMNHFIGGTVPAGSLFLMSDENPNSYDGRYFGFIKQEQIIGIIKPL